MTTHRAHRICAVVISIASLLAVACTADQAGRPLAVPSPVERGVCPLGVEGTEIAIRDVDAGVELTFTSRDHVEELRRRVLEISAQHGPGAHRGVGHQGDHGVGQGHGLHLADLPAMNASYEEVAGGARLRLAAFDPDECTTIRIELRRRADAMAARECD